MNKAKKQRTKPYRSALSNAIWSFQGIWKDAPCYFLLILLEIPLNVCLAYTEIYLPSLVVAEITNYSSLTAAEVTNYSSLTAAEVTNYSSLTAAEVTNYSSLTAAEVANRSPLAQIAFKTGAVILVMLVCHVVQNFSDYTSRYYLARYRFQRCVAIDRKSLNLFFQDYEKKEIRDLRDRATRATQLWNGVQPVSDVPKRSLKLVENVPCYLLFGSVISFVSPLLVPVLTIASAVNWFCARAYRN